MFHKLPSKYKQHKFINETLITEDPLSTLGKTLRLLLAPAVMAAALITTPAHASTSPGGPFGLGIVLGDPSALTARYDYASDKAIDAGVSFFTNNWVLVYVDGLYKFEDGFGHSHSFFAHTTPYIGAGLLAVSSTSSRHDRYFSGADNSNFALGVRVPLGAEWKPSRVPIGVFVEVSPGLVVIPGTYGFLQSGIGIRYYF